MPRHAQIDGATSADIQILQMPVQYPKQAIGPPLSVSYTKFEGTTAALLC